MELGKEITIHAQEPSSQKRSLNDLSDKSEQNPPKSFSLEQNSSSNDPPPAPAFQNISTINPNNGGALQKKKVKHKNLWVSKNRNLSKSGAIQANNNDQKNNTNNNHANNNHNNNSELQNIIKNHQKRMEDVNDQENQLQNKTKNRKDSNDLGGITIDFNKNASNKQTPELSPINKPNKDNSNFDEVMQPKYPNQIDKVQQNENSSGQKNKPKNISIRQSLQSSGENSKGKKQPVIQPKGYEWEASIINDSQFINKIFSEGTYRPTKEWKEQFEKDISEILLGSEVQDKRAVGGLLGVTVFGIVGFVASGLNPIGLVAGAIAGGVIGQYAGRKIKKKLLRTKKLLQFDLFTLKLNCYIRFGIELIKPLKFDINTYRFYMEKVLEEMKVAIQYKRFREKFHKEIKKILEKIILLMKKEECYKAIYLSYKLTKEILKRKRYEMDNNQQTSLQKNSKTTVLPNFTSEEEDQIVETVLNVLQPTLNILRDRPDLLTPNLKEFEFKLDKLLKDYIILNLIEKGNQVTTSKNKTIKQIEELDQQLDQEINIEAFERIFNPEHIKQFMNKEDNLNAQQGYEGQNNLNTPKISNGLSANKNNLASGLRKSQQKRGSQQNNEQNQEFQSFHSNNPNNNGNIQEINGNNKNGEDDLRSSNSNQLQEKRQQRIIDLYLEAIEMRKQEMGNLKKEEDHDVGDDEKGEELGEIIELTKNQSKKNGSQNIPSQYPTFSKQHLSKIAKKDSIHQSPINPFNNFDEEMKDIASLNKNNSNQYQESNFMEQGSQMTNLINDRQQSRKVSNIQIKFDQIPQKKIEVDIESLKESSTPVEKQGLQLDFNQQIIYNGDQNNKNNNKIASLTQFIKNESQTGNQPQYQPSQILPSQPVITQTNIHNIPPVSHQPAIPRESLRSFARNDNRTFLKMNSDESLFSNQNKGSPTNQQQIQLQGDNDQPLRDSVMPSAAQIQDSDQNYKNQPETPQKKSNFSNIDVSKRGSITLNSQQNSKNQASQFKNIAVSRDDNHKEEIVIVNIPEIKEEKMSQSVKSEKKDQVVIDKETQEKFDRLISLVQQDPEKTWECVIKKDDSMFIYKKMIPGNPCVLVRAESTIKGCNSEEVFVQIYNAQIRSQWDKVTQGFTVLDTISEGVDVIYFFVDPGLGVTKRDFCQTRVLKRDYPEKGQITIVFFSIVHPSCPERKGYIRAHSHIAGYVIRPLGNDTSLTIMTQSDVKGSVPKYVVNFMAARAPPKWIESMKKGCIDYRNKQNGTAPQKKKK